MNDFHLAFRCSDSSFAFFLEAVQDEYRFFKLDCIDGAVGSARIVFNKLQYACAAKTLQHLCRIVLLAVLREMQSVPEEFAYRNRKCQQIFLAASDPDKRLLGVVHENSIP